MCYKKLLNIVLYYEKKNIEKKKKTYVEFLQVIVKRAFRYQLFKSGCLFKYSASEIFLCCLKWWCLCKDLKGSYTKRPHIDLVIVNKFLLSMDFRCHVKWGTFEFIWSLFLILVCGKTKISQLDRDFIRIVFTYI